MPPLPQLRDDSGAQHGGAGASGADTTGAGAPCVADKSHTVQSLWPPRLSPYGYRVQMIDHKPTTTYTVGRISESFKADLFVI